jgi:hypothetical protein
MSSGLKSLQEQDISVVDRKIHTGSEAHPASYPLCTGVLYRVKAARV